MFLHCYIFFKFIAFNMWSNNNNKIFFISTKKTGSPAKSISVETFGIIKKLRP